MFKVQTPVLVLFTLFMVRCIYGDAEDGTPVDDIQQLQTGNFPRRPLVEADHLSPFVQENGHASFSEIPAEIPPMKYEANNPSYNKISEGDKMSSEDGSNMPPMGLTETQQDYFGNVTTNEGEQTVQTKAGLDFNLVDGVNTLRNQTADLLRGTVNNLDSIKKIAKILETLKTSNETFNQEMFENGSQSKLELSRTLSILEHISAVIINGITKQANVVPKPGFKPVKTIADVMALGKRSDLAYVDKKSFFCPLMYRTAFSVRRCWMFANMIKTRQERMRRLAAAREMAAKRKFFFSTFRRMTKPSA